VRERRLDFELDHHKQIGHREQGTDHLSPVRRSKQRLQTPNDGSRFATARRRDVLPTAHPTDTDAAEYLATSRPPG
jgi:hypothetical protein